MKKLRRITKEQFEEAKKLSPFWDAYLTKEEDKIYLFPNEIYYKMLEKLFSLTKDENKKEHQNEIEQRNLLDYQELCAELRSMLSSLGDK